MFNRCSQTRSPARPTAVELITVWEVDEKPGYDVRGHWPRAEADLQIVIRTTAGTGGMDLEDGTHLDVVAGSLLVVPAAPIRRYRCLDRLWRFWWFELRGGGPPFPRSQVLTVPEVADDAGLIEQCCRCLRWGDIEHALVASALCTTLLYRWWRAWAEADAGGDHQRLVQAAMDLMVASPDGCVGIAALARRLAVSERHLRAVFQERLGVSPKAFLDGLRLDQARQLLRLGGMPVAEVAARLGYSSPFHFSRSFSRRFGFPPSARR